MQSGWFLYFPTLVTTVCRPWVCRPLLGCSPQPIPKRNLFFQIWVWNRGPGNLKKKVSMPFWSEYEGKLPCDDGSQNYEKTLSFLDFLIKTCCFTYGKLMFVSFKGHSGPWMTTSISSSPKKHRKTLSFWTLFLAAEFVASKAEFVTGCFVCTGSEFFPKHSVLRRREASFQLQEIRGGPPGGQGHSGHTSLGPKRCT